MPEAYSVDGRSFAFRAGIGDHLVPGTYVSVDVPDGPVVVGQILDARPMAGEVFSTPAVEGTGVLVQTGSPFVRGTLSHATPDQISKGLRLEEGFSIGHLADAPESPASLQPKGFSRHTFVCGQSGSGKTYTTGVILERLLHSTTLPMVILDPNSDYVRIGELLPAETTGYGESEYSALRARHDSIAKDIMVMGGSPGDLRLWLGNLAPKQQATVLGLDPIADAEEVDTALSIVEELGTSRFNPSQLKEAALERGDPIADRLALRIGNLGLDRMSIWADRDNPAIADRIGDDWRALVFDLGAFDRPVERSIISAALIGHIWRRRHERRPLLLVIDEAHNVCPQDPKGDPNLALATDDLIAIAGEGRKYGIYLMLATQRPQKIHENVLSQCENLVLMRMNSRADIEQLTSAFSAAPPALIERSANFELGEGLAYGKIAPNPLLFKTGRRVTPEGGQDIPTSWIHASHSSKT